MSESHVVITLPALGEGVAEATISRWLVAGGDDVEAGDPVLEVATDKVDTEIPSPYTGTVVEVLVDEDDVVKVGTALAVMALSAVTGSAGPTAAGPPPAACELRPAATEPETVPGSSQSHPPATTSPAQPAAAPKRPTTETATITGGAPSTPQKLPRIRQIIASRMLESLHTSAQLTSVVEVDVTAIAELREANRAQFLDRTGVRLSFLPFFAKATIEALARHPILGARVNAECTEITYPDRIDLGIAVDSPKGLMVPVIRAAQHLGIADLASEIFTAAEQVRTGSISPDALVGGTFTLTNTGSRGALFDTPILNIPQSGILGTGAVVKRVVPQPDVHGDLVIAIRSMVYLALTYDHRIVDGADAARFLMTIKQRLEHGYTTEDLYAASLRL